MAGEILRAGGKPKMAASFLALRDWQHEMLRLWCSCDAIL
jgi:hypothetical protein